MRRSPRGASALSVLAFLALIPAVLAWGKDPLQTLRLPPERVFDTATDAPAPVVFSHVTHVALTGGSCVPCHPRPFRLLRPVGRVSHAEMDAGLACGACHDTKAAFGTADADSCASCHAESGAPRAGPRDTAWPDVLPSVRLPGGADSPGAVTFRHATHLNAEPRCSPCHPSVFAMRASSTRLSKDALLAGKACGACHDGRKAFGVDDERCERCHEERP